MWEPNRNCLQINDLTVLQVLDIQPSMYIELRSCVKSRWPSWAPVPNKPTVSVDVKQHSTNSKLCFVKMTCNL